MQETGITRRFTGVLEEWDYQPPNDTALAAAEIRRRIGLDAPAPEIESRKLG